MRRELEALVGVGEQLRALGYRFVTVTPETHRRVVARPPERAESLRDVFGWNRPFDADRLPRGMLDKLQAAAAVTARPDGLWVSRVRYSTLGPALFVHSAYPTTAADAVFFGPDTYRFCSMLGRSGQLAGRRRAVDVGCGSGAGGIVAALSGVARVVLADINERALDLARVNVRLAGVEDRVEIVESDILSSIDGEIDLVVSNPPYLRDPLVRAYRHGGGDYGEALSVRIAAQALERLSPGGALLLYTGSAVVGGEDTFFSAVRPVLERGTRAGRAQVEYEELDPDIFGEELSTPAYERADRIAAVGLTVVLA